MTKKRLYVLLGCLLLVLAMGTVGAVLYVNRAKPVVDEAGVKLYWNIDREQYVGDSSAGMNSRERAEDGFFSVRFALDGEQVEYKVEKARLVQKIDTMDVMGLAINADGIITKVFDPEDITGGEVFSKFYVVFGSDETITVCEEKDLDGDYKMMSISEDTGVYNVTGMDPVGHKDAAVTSDRIRAFQNENEEITHVFIIERFGFWAGESEQRYCEHCKETVDWYVWEEKYSLPTESGHWMLKHDVRVTAQHRIVNDQKLVLNLNGKTVTGPDSKRIYAMVGDNSSLAIMDSSQAQTGVMVGHGAPDNGGIIYVRLGTFELYSGTLDASDIEMTQYATAVRIQKNCTFNMYGGEIIGGTALGSMNEDETSTTGGYGGTIQVAGTFNMYDGVIRDGKVLRYEKKDGSFVCGNGGNLHLGTDSVFNMYGGEIKNGTAQRAGGNIYMGKNVVVNISGGTISGGVVMDDDRNGGNIFVNTNSKELNMTGGTIKDGKTLGAGGNIALNATMNMSGGTITGGSSMKGTTLAEGVHFEDYPHHNIFCAGGTFNMSGGLVEGAVRIRDTATKECTVNLSGTAQIKGGSINLYLDPGDDVNVGTLQKGAAIYINGGGYVSTKTAKSNVAYVHSSYEGVETQYINNKIFIGQQSCVCGQSDGHIGGCDGTVLDWIPWGTKSSMPNLEANWYLVVDVKATSQTKIAEKANFRLNLNGHTVTADEGVRVYALRNGGINMVLTDLSAKKDGKIVTQGKIGGRASCIWVSDNSTLVMYGGTLDASKAVVTFGGAMAVDEGSKAIIYNGNIIGGKSLYTETKTDGVVTKSNGFGGSLAVYGTMEMYGGNIEGGYSEGNGGNVYVTTNGKFLLAGGVVKEGQSNLDNPDAGYGGNFYVNGMLTISGGTIDGGLARQGGNVYVKAATKEHVPALNISGGSIVNGAAGKNGNPGTGGNVVALGAFTMTDGKIAGGVVYGKEDQSAANVYTKPGANKCTFTMTGGSIAGLVKANNEGTLTIGGTAKITGGATNLMLSSDARITIDGLKEGALIGVSPQYDTYFASGAVSGDEKYFAPDKQYKLIELVDKDKLIIVPDWEPWTKTDVLPTESGMYYLTDDVTVDAAAAVDGASIMLDLKGHVIETSTQVDTIPRVYVLKENSTLNIYDSSEAGTGKIVSHRKYAANAGVIEIRGEGANFNLYSGTIDASDVELLDKVAGDTTTSYYGAAVYVNSGTTFNMYGGTIIGGKAYFGGSVYVNANAKFHLEGGTITGGTATSYGGNVHVSADRTDGTNPGEFIMSGGTVTEGTARQGGNIYLRADDKEKTGGAKMTLSGGEITAGTAVTGGNITAMGAFEMIGGTISGGTSTGNAADNNVYTAPGTNGCTFKMSGGTISGFVRANGKGNIELSGTAKIIGGTTNLTLTDKPAKILTIGLTEGAEVSVNVEYSTYYFTDSNTQNFGQIQSSEDLQYLKADNGSSIVVVQENKLTLVTDWTSTNSLPTAAGSYRLMNPVTMSAVCKLADGQTVSLDLNGQSVTMTEKARVFQIEGKSTLNIVDTSANANGTIYGYSGSEGGILLVHKEAAVNLYSGKLDASKITSKNTTGGGSVSVRKDSVFNMYGGTITSGKTTKGGGNVLLKEAGAIFNMYGGLITVGTANDGTVNEESDTGGNIMVNAGATFNMYGGEVSKGTAGNHGGNIYVQADRTNGTKPGVFSMYGGTVTEGTARQGGNVYLQSDNNKKTGAAKLHISAGTIQKGEGTTTAGNIAALGVFEMSGGEIKEGICDVSGDHKYAANVYALPGKEGASFKMTGGTIQGWVRVNQAGTLTFGGTAKITNGSGSCGLHISKNGATISIDSEKPLVNGAEIYLSANSMEEGTKLATGNIEEAYRQYLKACGTVTLKFKEDGIYVAE